MEKAATHPLTSVLRPAARRLQRSMATHVAGVLADVGESVAEQAGSLLVTRGVRKSDEPPETHLTPEEIAALADQIVQQIDLGGLDAMIDLTRGDLEAMALDGARVAMAMVGVTDQAALVDVVNQRAVDYARSRSAELVGKRVLEDGTIIDNPDARWAISQSTRDGIRDMISSHLSDNDGSDAIVADLRDSFLFSPERADMVSRTEIAMANSEAAMVAYREADGIGISVKKQWILGPEPCPICEENADEGPIELDDTFPSGDDTVPAHPNCECAVIPVTESGDDAGTEEEE